MGEGVHVFAGILPVAGVFCESFWFVSLFLFVKKELLSAPRVGPKSTGGCS